MPHPRRARGQKNREEEGRLTGGRGERDYPRELAGSESIDEMTYHIITPRVIPPRYPGESRSLLSLPRCASRASKRRSDGAAMFTDADAMGFQFPPLRANALGNCNNVTLRIYIHPDVKNNARIRLGRVSNFGIQNSLINVYLE